MCPPPGSISLLAGINVVLRDVQTRHVLLTADLQMWLSAAGTIEEASENHVAGGPHRAPSQCYRPLVVPRHPLLRP